MTVADKLRAEAEWYEREAPRRAQERADEEYKFCMAKAQTLRTRADERDAFAAKRKMEASA